MNVPWEAPVLLFLNSKVTPKTEWLRREKIKPEKGKIVAEVSVSFLLPQNPPNKNT